LSPLGLAVASDGSIYVCDDVAKRIVHFSAGGERLGFAGPVLNIPYGLAADPAGGVYVTEATATGRIEEFAQLGWDPAGVPDPQDPATFARSKLDWTELDKGRHARLLSAYRQLAGLRRELPELTNPAFGRNRCVVDEDSRLFTLVRGDVVVIVNFGTEEATAMVSDGLELRFETESGVDLAGTTVTVPGHAGALLAPSRTR